MAKAAQELGVSRPVVSRSISDLEHLLGVPLFDRMPQGLVPTPYGEALLQRSFAVVDDLRQSVLEIENLNLAPPEQWADIKVDEVQLDERDKAATLVHEEYRDDRYVAALKLSRGEAKLFYLVRAVTPGTYTVPPPQLEDMYRPELRAIGKTWPDTITVVQP